MVRDMGWADLGAGRRYHQGPSVERHRRVPERTRHLLQITERWPIHRNPPAFDELEPKTEMLETGIKVLDLLTPYVQGGKIGLFVVVPASARPCSFRR